VNNETKSRPKAATRSRSWNPYFAELVPSKDEKGRHSYESYPIVISDCYILYIQLDLSGIVKADDRLQSTVSSVQRAFACHPKRAVLILTDGFAVSVTFCVGVRARSWRAPFAGILEHCDAVCDAPGAISS